MAKTDLEKLLAAFDEARSAPEERKAKARVKRRDRDRQTKLDTEWYCGECLSPAPITDEKKLKNGKEVECSECETHYVAHSNGAGDFELVPTSK